MVQEMELQEVKRDSEQTAEYSGATIGVDRAIRLISRCEGAEMLKAGFAPLAEWALHSEVLVTEVSTALQQHLSNAGWRRVVAAMHQHNRQTSGPHLDLAEPNDLLKAIELALEPTNETNGEEPVVDDDLIPGLRRQVEELMREQLGASKFTGWLLSPRALMGRLSAQARRARTKTRIENAVSETALHIARMVGTDKERDVALRRVAQLRDELGAQLEVFCAESGVPPPQPFSREEAHCLHLLNAYFVALAEAEGVIAQRGANLARRQIALEGEWAEARMDNRLLPGLLGTLLEVNPLRESLFRERIRHRLALLSGGLLGAIGGILCGIIESISEILIASVTRCGAVVAPALLTLLMTLVAQTLVYDGAFTLNVIAEFLMRALWNASLAFGATILVYGCWLYFATRREKRISELNELPH